MIARDLELLGVVRKLNAEMGGIVATLLDQMVDGQLPAHKLRELACIARDLASVLDGRAEEISSWQEPPQVIDGELAEPIPPDTQGRRGPEPDAVIRRLPPALAWPPRGERGDRR